MAAAGLALRILGCTSVRDDVGPIGNLRVLNPTIKLVAGVTKSEKQLDRAISALTKREVLVGVPEKTAPRKDSKGTKVNNALIAYVHDNGSPLRGIPQREFLRPGIKMAQKSIVNYLSQAARSALAGDAAAVERGLTAAGLEAQKSVRRKITIGPFAPLKPATIRARQRRHKGRSLVGTTPLVDTGQLRQSINFVVMDKDR